MINSEKEKELLLQNKEVTPCSEGKQITRGMMVLSLATSEHFNLSIENELWSRLKLPKGRIYRREQFKANNLKQEVPVFQGKES